MGLKNIVKSLRVKKDAEGEKEAAKKAEGEMAEKEDSVKKEDLSEGAKAALKAVARILTPFKEEISDSDVDGILADLGIQEDAGMMDEAEKMKKSKEDEDKKEAAKKSKEEDDKKEAAKKSKEDGEEEDDVKKLFAIPSDVKEEHAVEALSKAKEAMDEHLEKMGYAKYPDAEMAQKAKGDDEVEKSKYSHVFKANKDLIQKAAKLEKELSDIRKENSTKEIVQKAASFDRLGLKKEDVIEVLTAAKEMGPTHYEKICKHYSALNEQAKTGSLFAELGSKLGNNGASDAEAKIDAAVAQIVQKSKGVSKEQAYSDFLMTAEGKALYNEVKASRPGGI